MSEFLGTLPDEVRPGDLVIPTSGRYLGIQCEVKDVRGGPYSRYHFVVVPTIPVPDEWSVYRLEPVRYCPRKAAA